jgi:hypothetical protein
MQKNTKEGHQLHPGLEMCNPPDRAWKNFLGLLVEHGLAGSVLSCCAGHQTTCTDAYLCWMAQGQEDDLLWALYKVFLDRDLQRHWQIRGALAGDGFCWFLETRCPAEGWTEKELDKVDQDIDLIVKALPAEINEDESEA